MTAVTLNEQEILFFKTEVKRAVWKLNLLISRTQRRQRSKQSTVIILDSLFSHYVFTFNLLSICLCSPQMISFNTAAL